MDEEWVIGPIPLFAWKGNRGSKMATRGVRVGLGVVMLGILVTTLVGCKEHKRELVTGSLGGKTAPVTPAPTAKQAVVGGALKDWKATPHFLIHAPASLQKVALTFDA